MHLTGKKAVLYMQQRRSMLHTPADVVAMSVYEAVAAYARASREPAGLWLDVATDIDLAACKAVKERASWI